jgi:2-keto-4-pentenoate hydratase/2-oxohepta-3-ene-1,7-dioic acid hydratase in catechol pathway
MRLATIRHQGKETAAIVSADGLITLEELNRATDSVWSTDLLTLITSGQFAALKSWYHHGGGAKLQQQTVTWIPLDADYAPPYRRPRKIWGIGLNYVEHARDLSETAPSAEPASFMKPDTAIIGPGETIRVPLQSERTTGEAELGIVIGQRCKDVPQDQAYRVVAGFVPIIDITAEDILQRNPRNLTLSKSFDSFFSFGPHLVTPDEIEDPLSLQVATYLNGQLHRRNVVANMTFRPDFLIAFHSRVMTLLPGDIISTGTPGAVVISDGDLVEARIDGFPTLANPVRDLKLAG